MEQEGSRAEGVNLGSEDVKEADIPQWCAQLEEMGADGPGDLVCGDLRVKHKPMFGCVLGLWSGRLSGIACWEGWGPAGIAQSLDVIYPLFPHPQPASAEGHNSNCTAIAEGGNSD